MTLGRWMPVVLLLLPAVAAGQDGRQGTPARPDSPEVTRYIDEARARAGADWKSAYDFFCSAEPNRANRPDDPLLEPTRIFDNVYVIGRVGTAVFAITTSDGIVLFDAGYADQLETVLRPGLKALGLDEAQVKYIILGHGHADHFGGAPYFQQKYGTRVAMLGADWDLVENPPPGRGAAANPGSGGAGRGAAPAGAPPAPPPPKRDLVLTDGQTLTVGDETFRIIAVPGHTPGSLGLIFPVKAGGATHTAGIFGGTVLIPGFIQDAAMQQYVASIERFAAAARSMNVDVELQNHPLYDNIAEKIAGVRSGRRDANNPFVVGADSYQRFLSVQAACAKAQLARRAK